MGPLKKKARSNSLPSSSHHISISSPEKIARPENLRDNHQPLPNIPDHVVFSKILPFLSFDVLAKLKCVCKNWCSLISSNPMLPLDRFRHRVSSYSGVAFSHCTPSGQLVFLPTLRGGPVVAPDFLNVSFSHQPCKEILASANGLLCLQCSNGSIYVCNPLTKQGHIVALSKSWQNTPGVCVVRFSIGLAYDPSKSPAHYKLVCPWLDFGRGRTVFGFEVYSSHTKRWNNSCNEYFEFNSKCWSMMQSTYAGGVLYWDCYSCLIYFDPEKDTGGTVSLPFHQFNGYRYRGRHEIGEFAGHVTCSRVSSEGMQLWIMDVNRKGWELMHWVRFEAVVENNQYVFRSAFCNMPLRNRKDLKILLECSHVLPLPYEGGERLFLRAHIWSKKQLKVLCCDVKSGKLTEFCTLWPATYNPINNSYGLLYQSSMVSLTKLAKTSF